ncbi:MAG: hemolysin family protein [Acidimicrobiales bacterium]
MNVALGLILILLLVAANGFFVAIEFALIAADRSKLETQAEEGSATARITLGVLRRISFNLSGAQLGITVTSLVLGFLAEPLVGQLIDPAVKALGGASGSAVSALLALAIATVFQMVAGELIPKNLALAKPEATSKALSPAARIVHGAFSPIITAFNGAANWTVRRLGIEPTEELSSMRSLEEIEYLIQSSATLGTLAPDALSLLTRTIRFGDKTAADALTPRVHVDWLPLEATVGEFIEHTNASGHSRYPVCDGDIDDIRGVVDVVAVFDLPIDRRNTTLVSDIMGEAHVVPETRDLVDILGDFRRHETQMLVVVDEHGGTAGILTLEDVLEEITGDIDDEYDEVTTLGVSRTGVFIIDGTLHADEVDEVAGFRMPDGDYETIAGFLLDRLGSIPAEGTVVLWEGWQFEVVAMDGLRIASIEMVAPVDGSDDVAASSGTTSRGSA